MKSPRIVFSVAALAFGGYGTAALAADASLSGFPPAIAQAMEVEQAALVAATNATKGPMPAYGSAEGGFRYSRSASCLSPGGGGSEAVRLTQDTKARDCWLQWTQTRTRLHQLVAAAAARGRVPDDLVFAVNNAKATLPASLAGMTVDNAGIVAPVAVDPLQGVSAKIQHADAATTLSYSDASGAQHRYTVARPKFAQGMIQGDSGGWLYVAPDHKSGIVFNVENSGQVSGKPANPMMLQMMAGP